MQAFISSLWRRDWRGLALPLAFVLLWALASWQDWVNPKLIPAPADVLAVAWQSVLSREFVAGVFSSLYRDLAGFFAGALAGVAAGLALGISRWIDRLFGPSFNLLKQISMFAWLPLISAWLGYDDGAKILFIAASAFYPVAINTYEGVRGVTRSHYEVAQVLRFTIPQLIWKLALPSALPRILIGLQLGLVFAWLATIGSELLLANWGHGLGNLVIRGREAFNMPLIIFGMLVIGLIGTLLNRCAQRLERRWLAWQGPRR